jgi:hypothetical protein
MMKKIQQFGLLLLASVMMLMTACVKNIEGGNVLPNFVDGNAPVLSITSTTFAPAAADSNNSVLTLNWTNPRYSVDPATVRFVVQVDTINGNFFRNPVEFTVTGVNSLRWLNKEFNNLLLSFGLPFNVARAIDIRVISSHGNNNERLISNVIRVAATPYRIPPRVALPASNELYIVGNAFNGVPDWNNPAGTRDTWPAFRRLWRRDETTWEGIYNMKGDGFYLLLQQFGNNWSNKYSVQNNSLPGLANGGAFGFELPQDFPGNVNGGAGWHRLSFDFQQGRFTVARITTANYMMPENLWLTGDGAGGWTDSPPPANRFTALSNGVFQIDRELTPGRLLKFLSTQGAWQPQFGGSSATGGPLGAAYVSGPEPPAIPTPATAGNYRITVNFHAMTYTIVRL